MLRLKIFCKYPSRFLGKIFDSAHATVALSATLEPFDFYRKTLGLPENRVSELSLPSRCRVHEADVIVNARVALDPAQLEAEVAAALAKVEKSVGKNFGDKERPLLVSVRSGARDSMPGMMDTILNLGMNDEVVEIVAKKTGNARFAWDSYRRFLQMYGDVVMGVQKRAGEDHEPFERAIEHLKDERYGKHDFPDVRLTVNDLKELVKRFKALIKERTGKSFPQDAHEQMWGSIGAVFGSWMNDRAIVYRRKYGIPHD